MNEVIKTLTSHRSFRHFEDREIPTEQLDAILTSAQAAPTWIHGQQVSVIVIKDKERKQTLASLCGNQKHIIEAPVFLIFCADFYRTKLASKIEQIPMEAIHDVDMLLVGATDVGISLSNAIAASESLGLQIVPIGGIRKNPIEVVEYLNLPEYVIPICGLCIGYGYNDPGHNPRLPKEAFIHQEVYNKDQEQIIHTYNKTYQEHQRKLTDHENPPTWTARVASFYKGKHYNDRYPHVASMLKKQGFTCDDIKN